MNPREKISMEALIAEDGMPVSAGRALMADRPVGKASVPSEPSKPASWDYGYRMVITSCAASTVGATVGAFFGGPGGAAVGAATGSVVGSMLGRQFKWWFD
jgi:uncharacterized membrane protein